MASTAELIDKFRNRGLKVTPQRERIFQAICGAKSHPTAEAVFQEVRKDMSTISLKTVYETLRELVEMGELHQLDFGTGSARFDPNVDTHHHLVCDTCGKIADFSADFDELKVPLDQDQGFVVGNAEVTFRGSCHECQKVLATR